MPITSSSPLLQSLRDAVLDFKTLQHGYRLRDYDLARHLSTMDIAIVVLQDQEDDIIRFQKEITTLKAIIKEKTIQGTR